MRVFYEVPQQTRPTAVALGAFDGLHIGHMELIERAVTRGRALQAQPCVYTFAHNPSGALTLTDNVQRERLLRQAGIELLVLQDFTEEFRNLSPHAFLQQYLVDRLRCISVTVGFNYRFGKDCAGDVDILSAFCQQRGIECNIVPPVLYQGQTVSSTAIRQCIEAGDLSTAAAMLGRWYSVEGTVQSGDRIGRTIGFPTANIATAENRVMPPRGVYVTKTHWNGGDYLSVTNFGGKPTLREGLDLIETHILDFSKDIYGAHITVSFLEKIREIYPFASLEALAAQLQRDKEYAREYR